MDETTHSTSLSVIARYTEYISSETSHYESMERETSADMASIVDRETMIPSYEPADEMDGSRIAHSVVYSV